MNKTPWQQEQADLKHKEKQDNVSVLAFYIKEKDGQNYRHVPVSCPKRLLEIVRKEGQEKYGENYIHIPTAKE